MPIVLVNIVTVSSLSGSRPGDDYLLNFCLSDYPDVKTNKEDDDISFPSLCMIKRCCDGLIRSLMKELRTGTTCNHGVQTMSVTENKLILTLSVGDGGLVIDIPDYSAIRTGGDEQG